MRKPKLASWILACLLGLSLLPAASFLKADEPASEGKTPPEHVIFIGHPELFSHERPPARFKHDFHMGKLDRPDCVLCHRPDGKGGISATFYDEAESKDKKLYMERYHTSCLGCHNKRQKGPRTCGECHAAGNRIENRKAFFEHGYHVKLLEHGCHDCHHKGRESESCSKCHTEKDEGDRPSLRKAGHERCFGCHYKTAGKKVTCVECHLHPGKAEPAMKAHSFKKPAKVHMGSASGIMPSAVFDHKRHEKEQPSCRGCHSLHVHSIGSLDEDFPMTNRMCIDCHEASGRKTSVLDADRIYHDEKLRESCAGCHKSRGKGPRKTQCSGCHKGLVKTAKMHAQAEKDILISELSDKYEPVSFTHQKHAASVGCGACHHHNPKGRKLSCRACHGTKRGFNKLDKPALRGVFHRQCIDCHRQMGVGPVKCAGCHAEKKGAER